MTRRAGRRGRPRHGLRHDRRTRSGRRAGRGDGRHGHRADAHGGDLGHARRGAIARRGPGPSPASPTGTTVRYRIEAWSSQHRRRRRGRRSIAGVVARRAATRRAATPTQAWFALRPRPVAGPPARRRTPSTSTASASPTGCATRSSTRSSSTASRRPAASRSPSPATPGGFYGGTLRGVIRAARPHRRPRASPASGCRRSSRAPRTTATTRPTTASIEPRLGTEDDLRELCELAHARGLRVLLDFVVNHVSSAHPAFLAALRDPASPEASWFTFTDWPDDVPVVLRRPRPPPDRQRRPGRARRR